MLGLNVSINSSFNNGKEHEPQPLVFRLEGLDTKPEPPKKNKFTLFGSKPADHENKIFSHDLLGGSVEVIEVNEYITLNLHILNGFEWWLSDTKDTSLHNLILPQTANRILSNKPVGDLGKEVVLYNYQLPINSPLEFNVMKGSRDNYTKVSSVSITPSNK